jgi:hypothetical protein
MVEQPLTKHQLFFDSAKPSQLYDDTAPPLSAYEVTSASKSRRPKTFSSIAEASCVKPACVWAVGDC